MSLGQFTNEFSTLLNIAKTGNIPFDNDIIRSTWIQAMPSHLAFTVVKQALWNQDDQLPHPWNSAKGPLQLQQVTSGTLLASGVPPSSFTARKSTRDPNNDPPTTSRKRLALPKSFSNISAYHSHLHKLVRDGWTREKLDKEYKEPFLKDNPGYDGCYVCRHAPSNNPSQTIHKDSSCYLLKKWFSSYSASSYCSSTGSNNSEVIIRNRRSTSPSQPTPPPAMLPTSISMCYDSGTTPFSLCDNPSYFSELVLYPQPREILLGDEDHTMVTLGQGLLDIIINNEYRIKQSAIFTSSTPTALMATRDHIRYQGCDVKSENGNLRVIFPSFSFLANGSDRFEFQITPGKNSNLPILWQPVESDLRSTIVLETSIHVVPIIPDLILPFRASPSSPGYDVSSSVTVSVPAHSTIKIPLGFKMAFPSTLLCSLNRSDRY